MRSKSSLGNDCKFVIRLFEQATATPGFDLQSQTLSPAGGTALGLHIDPARKHRLLNGLDDISLTLQRADRIRAYESQRGTTEPWLFT